MPSPVSRDYLNFQSNRIEAVLASNRIMARVHGGTVSPRWIRFHLTAALGVKINSVRNLGEEIALALGAPDVRVTRDGGSLAVDVPRSGAETVRLLPLLRDPRGVPPVAACLGLGEDEIPLFLRLPAPEVAHVLVAGTTGSGKTELLRTIGLSLALTNRQAMLQLALIDPKRRGLQPLASLPHLLAPLAADVESALYLLRRLAAEMERRDAEGISSPRIVIIADEAADLLMVGGKEIEGLLTRIAQRGREAGLHLVVGTQKPSSKVIGGLLKANFPVRLVGKVASADDARIAAGIGSSGAEKLAGRGEFVAVVSGQITRFQAAYVPAGDWAKVKSGFAR